MANFVNVKTYNSTLLDDLNGIKNQLLRLRLSNQPFIRLTPVFRDTILSEQMGLLCYQTTGNLT